ERRRAIGPLPKACHFSGGEGAPLAVYCCPTATIMRDLGSQMQSMAPKQRGGPRSIELEIPKSALAVQSNGPHLVRALVFGRAKRDFCADAEIQSLDGLQRVDELLGREIRPDFLQARAERSGHNVTLQRDEPRLLGGKVTRQPLTVLEDTGGAGA